MSAIACVNCGEEHKASLEFIDERKDLVCQRCGKSFSVGDAFQEAYDNNRIVKKSVDTTVHNATRKWVLRGKAIEATKNFLKQIKFDELLIKTATDILVHGDAFLLTVDPKKKTINWQLLPPQHVKLKASWVQDAQGSTPILKEDRFDFGAQSFVPDEVVHFKREGLGCQKNPYGESMIRIALPYVYHFRDFRKTPATIQSAYERWGELQKEQILVGLGVPDFVLKGQHPAFSRKVAEAIVAPLVGNVNNLQDLLAEGLNVALKRFAETRRLSETPTIAFKKASSRRVLIDCGFDLSDEGDNRAMIQKMKDIGLINQEACDRMLKEFDDEV